ncbi:hypothetical protein FS749_014088 [Ceratobasidium sp. UAMH 11750]|nr:hypothetical protein FS749_014088 [Ceratobasidium sp. UAMH 11750]
MPSEQDTFLQVGEGSEAGSTEVDCDHRQDKTKHKHMKKAPKLELEEMIAWIAASKSKVYEKFKDPIIDWKNNPPTHYTFICEGCGNCTNKCHTEQEQANLQDFGIAGSSSQLSSEDVFVEYFALRVAKDRWPHHIISNQYLCKLITPQSHGYIPHHATVTRDIKIMYNMTQAEMIVQLAVSLC